MTRRFSHICFGLVVGLLSLLLPGHHTVTLLAAAALSLAGAAAGCFVAERFLPPDVVRPGGFPVSALGAIAMLLIYVIAAR